MIHVVAPSKNYLPMCTMEISRRVCSHPRVKVVCCPIQNRIEVSKYGDRRAAESRRSLLQETTSLNHLAFCTRSHGWCPISVALAIDDGNRVTRSDLSTSGVGQLRRGVGGKPVHRNSLPWKPWGHRSCCQGQAEAQQHPDKFHATTTYFLEFPFRESNHTRSWCGWDNRPVD